MTRTHRTWAVAATLVAFAGLAGCETHPAATDAPPPVTTGEKIKEKLGEAKEKLAEGTGKVVDATGKVVVKGGAAIDKGGAKLEGAVKNAESK
jgi:hypothetical protein